MPDPGLSPCAALVRERDPDRFATALFAAGGGREALMTLYAFNAEIAAIRERVREPMAGMVRLQWWRDGLEAMGRGQDLVHHPVAQSLAALIRERGLPVERFMAILEAREHDLAMEPPPDWEAVDAYAGATGGFLSQLAAMCLGGDEQDQKAALHAGTAFALVGLARALPVHASMGRLTVPADVAGDARFPQAVEALCSLSRKHLDELRGYRTSRCVIPCLLPAVLADRYIGILKHDGWNPLSIRVVTRVRAPLALAWAVLRGSVQ